MRMSDWSSDVCSSDLAAPPDPRRRRPGKALAYIWVRSMYRPLPPRSHNGPFPPAFVSRTAAGAQVHGGIDEREMRQGLGEISKQFTIDAVHLFGDQTQIVRLAASPFEQPLRSAERRVGKEC